MQASCIARAAACPSRSSRPGFSSLLVSRPGELVTREELRQLVWTNETFVEFDASLNAAHHQGPARPRRFRQRSPLHRDRPETRLPLSRGRAGASAGNWSGIGGQRRRLAGCGRCSSGRFAGYRSSTGAAGCGPSAQDRPAGRRGGHATFRVAAVTRTRETIGRADRAVADGAALRAARGGDAPEPGKRAGGGDRQAARSTAHTHRQAVAARRYRRSARTESRARRGRPAERGRHANRPAARDRAAYRVHRRRARPLGRCRRSARQRSDVAGITDRPAGRGGARRADERERARGARPSHDGEPRRVSMVPAGTNALRTADEARPA